VSDLLLQLGAEGAPLPGHVRLAPTLAGDLEYIASHGLPFLDRSVAAIHCDGLIESMTQAEGLALLRECRRVLRHGGKLRIGTPDLDAIVAGYQSGGWGAHLPQAGQAEWVDNRAVALNLHLRGQGRRWLYNEQELAGAAVFAGLGAPLRLAGPDAQAGTLWLEFSADKPALPEQPLVSIVIPAYRVRFFGVALDSALAQTYANLEILVLDDSGDDAIAELVASRNAAQRIRYLRNTPPLGEAASLTRGIHAARGELIKPLYDDDVLTPDCVARLVAAMQAAPDALLALSRRDTIDAAGAPVAIREQALANASCEISGASLAAFTLGTGRNFLGPPSSVMFRRAPALTIPGNVMTLAGRLTNGTGDVSLYLNLLSRGEVVFVNEVLSAFRLHDSHTSSDPAIGHAERASWLYLKEHGARLGLTKNNFEIVIKRVL
jgi:hypothetical protein